MSKNCPVRFKTPEEFEALQDAIYFIHMSRSPTEYLERKESFKKSYIKHHRKAYEYMRNQLIGNEKFKNWQIFQSPPGYANNNSNIESFNRLIKGFTQKKKLSVFGIVDKCCEMVYYYSSEQNGRINSFTKFKTK
jgi:hypothetical protein